jgi:hypothetical protein
MKAWVEHGYYGCETGCCGHLVIFEDSTIPSEFDFRHFSIDYDDSWPDEIYAWIKEVAKLRGVEVEIDWDKVELSDD